MRSKEVGVHSPALDIGRRGGKVVEGKGSLVISGNWGIVERVQSRVNSRTSFLG